MRLEELKMKEELQIQQDKLRQELLEIEERKRIEEEVVITSSEVTNDTKVLPISQSLDSFFDDKTTNQRSQENHEETQQQEPSQPEPISPPLELKDAEFHVEGRRPMQVSGQASGVSREEGMTAA